MGTSISGIDGAINLADYASIKNGSYTSPFFSSANKMRFSLNTQACTR